MPSSCLMSVVIIVDKQRERGERALQSVLAQENIDDLEVLLFDLAESAAPLEGSDHASVRCFTMPGAARIKTWGEMRAEAVRCASAPIFAIIEEHSAALPGWALSTLKAFDDLGEAFAGVSGLAVNDYTRTGITDAVKLMNYVEPLPAHSWREASQLLHNNATYRRDALLKYDNELEHLMMGETYLYARMRHDGCKFAEVDAIKLVHVREQYLIDNGRGAYYANRIISRKMAALQHWSALKVLMLILATPVIPLARTVKLFAFWRRKDPSRLGLLARNILKVTAINTFAVMGQTMGLIFGMGSAGTGFLNYAINVPRPTPDMDRVYKALDQS